MSFLPRVLLYLAIVYFVFAIPVAQGKLQIGDKCGKFGTTTATNGSAATDNSMQSCDPDLPLECIGEICQCKRGFVSNRNESKCLEIARNGLDSTCEESIQCWKGLPGRLAECWEGKCRCYESETLPIVFHQGRCYYGEGLGDYCQIEGLCSQTTPNATCRSGTCQCREGHVASWDKSRCLQIATQGLNSSCEENVQCEKSGLGTLSECNQETMLCQCYLLPAMVPTVFHGGRCYFGASLGDVCQVSAQCEAKTPHSYCGLDGKCSCLENPALGVAFVQNSNASACLPVLPSDGAVAVAECLEDVQCTTTLGSSARCNLSSGKCECLDEADQPMVIVGAKCYSGRQMGQGCKYNRQCATVSEAAVCTPSGICGCEEDTHVTSEDGHRCLEVGKDGLGSPCEEDAQCAKSILGPLSTCEKRGGALGGTCRCSASLPVVFYEKTCFFQRQLGASCDSDAECKAGLGGPLAACLEGRCQCGNGTVVNSLHACEGFQGQPAPSISLGADFKFKSNFNMGLASLVLGFWLKA